MENSASTIQTATLTEIYEQVRQQIQHEDNLITQRLNWFLTSQSFLFTAYAIVFNGTPIQTAHNIAVRLTLLTVIPGIAIAAGVLILTAIIAGAIVMRNLRLAFAPYRQLALDTSLPVLQGNAATRIMGLLAPVALPVLFIAVWMILVVRMHG